MFSCDLLWRGSDLSQQTCLCPDPKTVSVAVVYDYVVITHLSQERGMCTLHADGSEYRIKSFRCCLKTAERERDAGGTRHSHPRGRDGDKQRQSKRGSMKAKELHYKSVLTIKCWIT